jgi:hypothetical protein
MLHPARQACWLDTVRTPEDEFDAMQLALDRVHRKFVLLADWSIKEYLGSATSRSIRCQTASQGAFGRSHQQECKR